MNALPTLELLKQVTVVVADTGEFSTIEQFQPQDATTNPSLIYKAVIKDEYKSLLDEAVTYAKGKVSGVDEQAELAMDKLSVSFGAKILGVVKGRVSTEIDARLSYDTEATIKRCQRLASLYEEVGVDWRQRVLFKIASTWEGIQAARVLEQFGYHCNLTLLFSFAQAIACADANATLISPFVGRILRLLQERARQELGRRRVGGSRCRVGAQHLQLLQKVWLQNNCNGS
eukprot:TRINITY_DN1675_c0_g2_i1.p1 TRINITY_DN1675_c0_g2~~TRINITY_DN1675_c0_g2_i1.p1  ORF type:complete len:265 (+),score=98.72 TRINITY_DN1675_c0_g2_i1:108-797(+)